MVSQPPMDAPPGLPYPLEESRRAEAISRWLQRPAQVLDGYEFLLTDPEPAPLPILFQDEDMSVDLPARLAADGWVDLSAVQEDVDENLRDYRGPLLLLPAVAFDLLDNPGSPGAAHALNRLLVEGRLVWHKARSPVFERVTNETLASILRQGAEFWRALDIKAWQVEKWVHEFAPSNYLGVTYACEECGMPECVTHLLWREHERDLLFVETNSWSVALWAWPGFGRVPGRAREQAQAL